MHCRNRMQEQMLDKMLTKNEVEGQRQFQNKCQRGYLIGC